MFCKSLILPFRGFVQKYPTILGIDACIHDGFIAFNNIAADYDIEFLYYIFASLESRFNNSATHGGVFTNLTTGSIKEFIIAAPPLPEQQQIASILSSVEDKLDVLQSKKTSYSTLKKGLMAKLLTGQMRVTI